MVHSPERQHEILQQIGEGLLDVVGDDWVKVWLHWSGTISISTVDFLVTRSDGREERVNPPDHVERLITDLRAEMYQEDLGTWFGFGFMITPPGSFSADYDYDSKPNLPFDLDPLTYNEDLNRFPRSRENHPEWLWDTLLEGARELRSRADPGNTPPENI